MPQKKHTLLLGAHMSIAGGIDQAIHRGESIDCTTIQIFTKSNRQWFAKKLTEESIVAFKEAFKQSTTIKSVVAHASYLINLGSPNKETNKKSIKAVSEELQRCNLLEIPYLIIHPGSHLQSGEKLCLQKIADNLNTILSKDKGKTMILLENMAGQGTNIGYTFEHIAELYQQSAFKKKIGVCFDTCHAFAAGYDFRNEKAYEKMLKELDAILGLKLLKVIHINDSKKELGSRIDRHEDIGKGKLGLEAFRLIFNDKRFFDIPKILETPKDDLRDDVRNMKIIKKLISPQNRKKLELE